MKVVVVSESDKEKWNGFILANYPTIGSFINSFRWGQFQEKLGRKIGRFFVTGGAGPVAAFMVVEHQLPFGYSYLYSPRGPIIAKKSLSKNESKEIFKAIETWAKKELSHKVFLRLEPSVEEMPTLDLKFKDPGYYVQPRHNLAVKVTGSEEDILAGFHSSTRSNIRRAKRRGVKVSLKEEVTEEVYADFFNMVADTARRNSGKNIYPDRVYFEKLFSSVPLVKAGEDLDKNQLSIACLYGYQKDVPAAIHFIFFFGSTATYIYGASLSDKLSSKVTTLLHFEGMKLAQSYGCDYYDLGGVDEVRWPSLTKFKKQFGGEIFSYIGNLDLPLNKLMAKVYKWSRKLKSLK